MSNQCFIHEIYSDPVNGDKETVVCNGLQMPLQQFQKFETSYKALPEGIKGFKYIPNNTHYYYNSKGEVIYVVGDIEPIVPIETLHSYLSKTDQYMGMIRDEQSTLELQAWDTGIVSDNRVKRISEIKKAARVTLNDTDWYIIRLTETAKGVPEMVLSYRGAVRKAIEDAESAINILEEVSAIKNSQVNWPEKL